MDVEHGQLVYPSLKDVAVVMDLHELAPVGRRATGRRDGRRFEGFAKMGQDLPNRPWLRDERDQPNVATTTGALEWKLLPHPGHQLGPGNPGGVVRAGLLMRLRVTAAPRGATVVPMDAVHRTGGQTWSTAGGSVDVSAGSLSLPAGVVGLPTDGNRAVLGNTGAQLSASRSLGTTYSSASPLWFSYLFTQSNTNNADGNNDGISLVNSGTSRIYFGSDGAGDLVIRAIAGQSVTAADAFANTFVGATSGQTFQLVVNIDPSTGYTMWVNPTGFNSVNGLPTGGTSASLTSNLLQFSFDTIQLGGDDSTNTNGSVTFDEFRMGTTAAAVVPEPSTCASLLAGLACGGYSLFRRRRDR